ncbi:MAG: SUMF1/EgtB/PvdO family nonheme iron enzyme [Planctomycetota bacterium]
MSPQVFISYSHDSAAHKEEVRSVADFLAEHGFDVILDQYEVVPADGWAAWSARAVSRADFILAICSSKYCAAYEPLDVGSSTGLGAAWEARMIRTRLYEGRASGGRVFPIVLAESDVDSLPIELRGLRWFLLPQHAEDLLCAMGVGPSRADEIELPGGRQPSTIESSGAVEASTERVPEVAPATVAPLSGVTRWLAAAVVTAGLFAALVWRPGTARELELTSADERQTPVALTPSPAEISPLGDHLVTLHAEPPLRSLAIADCEVEYDATRQSWTLRWRGDLEPRELRLPWHGTTASGSPASGELRMNLRYRSRAPVGFRIEIDDPMDRGFARCVTHLASGIRLRLCPAGEYSLGSDEREDEPRRTIRLDEPFYLGETEVTVAQWRAFAVASGYQSTAERSGSGGVTLIDGEWTQRQEVHWRTPMLHEAYVNSDSHPVAQIAFDDALAFCQHYGLRLPNEEEWEIACRAGSTTTFWWGDEEVAALDRANIADASLAPFYPAGEFFGVRDHAPFLAPVAASMPNDFHLFDMIGNVWEWCDNRGSRSQRWALRGGSWASRPSSARASNRLDNLREARSDVIGFRVAANPD